MKRAVLLPRPGWAATLPRVAVVGAGISGLAAAHYLRTLGGGAVEVTVYEKSPRAGGAIVTDLSQGIPLEGGPDSLLVRKTAGVGLVRELGLGDNLMATHPGARGADIFHEGVLYPIPPGLIAGVPSSPAALLDSGLLGPQGKRDLMRGRRPRPRRAGGDVSLGELLAYHLGPEVVDRIAAPLLSGIYAGDIWQLSARATYPQLLEWEQRYRSLIAGRAAMPPPPPGPRAPIFMTPRQGLESVVQALVGALSPQIRLNTPVDALVPQGTEFQVHTRSGVDVVDAVVLAVPATEAARLSAEVEPAAAALLGTIPYAPLAVVGLVFDPGDIELPVGKTGALVPKGEELFLTAATYVTQKWPYGEEGAVPVRVFYGRSGDDRAVAMSDEDLAALSLTELARLTPVPGSPRYVRVFRHRPGMPQYTVGHEERVQALEKCLGGWPRLRVCGSAFHGVGVPDCIKDGREQAEALIGQFAGGSPGIKQA